MGFSQYILLNVSLLLACWPVCPSVGLKGHLKPLGSHTPGKGVTAIGKFSSPSIFFSEFVRQGQPIWMRNALDYVNHAGLTNWTNDFLRKSYGHVSVNVEVSKKENRKQGSTTLTLKQFLNLYQEEDFYLVHSMRNSMEDLILVPPSLVCGGFQKVLQDAVMWFGSGTTSSVLHYDMLDNLLCLFDGEKDIVLIDENYKDAVEADGFVHDGSYSSVDVERVDMDKFPRLADVQWKRVKMRKGDCLYIPKNWYHQVTSRTDRHLAINFWFSHLYWFNETDCLPEHAVASQKLQPVSKFGFASSNEVLRSKLLDKLHDKGIMTKYNFVSSLDSSSEERREKFFNAVDKYKDSALSWSELYGFDIDKAVHNFPDIFDLPGQTSSLPDDFALYEPIAEHKADVSDNDDLDDDDDDEEEEEDEIDQKTESKRNLELPDAVLPGDKKNSPKSASIPNADDTSIDGENTIDNSDQTLEHLKERQELDKKKGKSVHKTNSDSARKDGRDEL